MFEYAIHCEIPKCSLNYTVVEIHSFTHPFEAHLILLFNKSTQKFCGFLVEDVGVYFEGKYIDAERLWMNEKPMKLKDAIRCFSFPLIVYAYGYSV